MRGSVWAVLALLMVGCDDGSSSTTGPLYRGATAFPGTYVLKSVNGSSLPASFSSSQGLVELRAGALVIEADGQFVLSDSLRYLPPATPTRFSESHSGLYVTSDTDITLVYGNVVITGGLAGNTLTLLRGGPAYVYQR
jgi:hypothetical protein